MAIGGIDIEEKDAAQQQRQQDILLQHTAEEGEIYQVTDGLKSWHTKQAYRLAFNHFIKVTVKSNNLRALLDYKHDVIERLIINHIKYLKDAKKLSYWSIQVRCSGILHFFKINDINLNTAKIQRFLPEDESERYGKDRPYDVTEIERILEKCDVRSKVVVYLLASTGMRIGALPGLRFEDIRRIDEYGIYMIRPYNRSRQFRYFTFCSSECTAAIDAYLDYRRKFHEEIKDKSPLIREQFNIDNPFTANAPRPISNRSMAHIVEEVLRRSGVNQINRSLGNKRRDVMRNHGFRKYFIHQCIKAKLTDSVWKQLVGHKLPRTNKSYASLNEEDLLTIYVHDLIPHLTIDPTQRLKQENAELRKTQKNYLAELGDLREEFNEIKQWLVYLKKDTSKELVHEFHQRTGDEVQEQWYQSEDYKEWMRSKYRDYDRVIRGDDYYNNKD